jgi:hypothetical protein
MFSDLSSKAVHHLSHLAVGYYAPVWVPIATQLAYRMVRYTMYGHMRRVEHFQAGSDKMKRRDDQHRLFIVLEGAQILAFFALSSSNPSYLIPACYTLAHLVWTVYSKSREHPTEDEQSKQKYWSSMDGLKSLIAK